MAATRGKSGPKRSSEQVAKDFEILARMDRRGHTQREIADVLGLHPQQVFQDLKKLKKRYAEAIRVDSKESVDEKLAQYREIRKEAWISWELSKVDAVKHVEESTPFGDCVACEGSGKTAKGGPCKVCAATGKKGGPYKVTKTKEARNPGIQYLQTVMQCLEAERELLGLDAPKKVEGKIGVNGKVQVGIDWDSFAQLVEADVPDAIEAKIVALIESAPLPLIESPTLIPAVEEVKGIESVESPQSTNGAHPKNSNGNGSL